MENKDITIKMHVASVTEHGGAGGHEAKLFVAADDKEQYVSLHLHTKDKLVELGHYELTLKRIDQ